MEKLFDIKGSKERQRVIKKKEEVKRGEKAG